MTNPNSSRPTSKLAVLRNYLVVLIVGSLVGAGGLWYLNEQNILARNSTVTTSQENPITTTNTENNPIPIGDGITQAQNDSVAVGSGDNSIISRDQTNSPSGNDNVLGDRQGSPSGSNSPSITGTSITVVYNNNDLPGFSTDSGNYIAPPSDLSKYSKASDLQPDSLMRQASALNKIEFATEEVVIDGKIYQSFFRTNPYTNNSRFVFKLDGTQKATLLQFGVPDLVSGNTSKGVYIVRIYADGNLLWAGECQRSQNRQIISVPIDIPGATALTIQVTSNGSNETSLYFTEARLLKD